MTAKPRYHLVHLKDERRKAGFTLAKFTADLRELFAGMVQALIEMAEVGSEKYAILEYIQNHLAAQGAAAAPRQEALLSK